MRTRRRRPLLFLNSLLCRLVQYIAQHAYSTLDYYNREQGMFVLSSPSSSLSTADLIRQKESRGEREEREKASDEMENETFFPLS